MYIKLVQLLGSSRKCRKWSLPPPPPIDPNLPTRIPVTVSNLNAFNISKSQSLLYHSKQTTVATPAPSDLCKTSGYHRDPNNCAVFYNCIDNGQGGWTVYSYTCPSGLVFDTTSASCTWPANVPECNGEAPAETTTTTTTTTTTAATIQTDNPTNAPTTTTTAASSECTTTVTI